MKIKVVQTITDKNHYKVVLTVINEKGEEVTTKLLPHFPESEAKDSDDLWATRENCFASPRTAREWRNKMIFRATKKYREITGLPWSDFEREYEVTL